MTGSPLSRLRQTASALQRADAERARRITARDAAIVAALEAGATWTQVQEASGLSPRGVQLAIKRHNAANNNNAPEA